MALFYLWRAAAVVPLELHGSPAAQYNALADAFLHLRLWIAHFPASVLGPEPLNPRYKPTVLLPYGEDSLHDGNVYLAWGPAPALVLLVPLHLFGFEPSASVIIAPFAIAGLGFSLAALRVILRVAGDVSLWLCTLAALALAGASVVPELVRMSEIYHEALAGGYCFTMAGLWLAVSAIANRRASLMRIGLMSLCFGLAAGSRPPLGLVALMLIPVYAALKGTRRRRDLLMAITLPVGGCFVLLAAYNYVRYGNPLEIGERYVIGERAVAYLNEFSFIPVGLWSYLATPPRITAIFPFVSLVDPQVTYPLTKPAHYGPYSEPTGGLLWMAPIAVFLVALPLLRRARPAWLGPLGPFLLGMTGIGVGILLFTSYVQAAATERYETDYMTLFMFGALAVWLILSTHVRRRRRLIRAGGGLLAGWTAVIGIAVALNGLQSHRDTWRSLVKLGSPLSTVIAKSTGHPILGDLYAPWIVGSPEHYGLSTNVSTVWLSPGDEATLTIVSPDIRDVTLLTSMAAGPALSSKARVEARVSGPAGKSRIYQLPPAGGVVRIVTHVRTGVNELAISPISVSKTRPGRLEPPTVIEPGYPLLILLRTHLVGS